MILDQLPLEGGLQKLPLLGVVLRKSCYSRSLRTPEMC